MQITLIELLFPNGDYQYKAQFGVQACHMLAVTYLRNREYEEVWPWLEKGADFAIHMETYDFDEPHTSFILRDFAEGGWIMEAEGNSSQAMLEWLTADEETAVLRSDPRYDALVNRLKQVAKKP